MIYRIYDQATDRTVAVSAGDACEAVHRYAEELLDLHVERFDMSDVAAEMFTEQDWVAEVQNGTTRLGYEEWLAAKLTAEWVR